MSIVKVCQVAKGHNMMNCGWSQVLCSLAPYSHRRKAFGADYVKMAFEKLAVKYFDYGWLNQSRKK